MLRTRAAARRRGPGRPRHRAVPAVVGPGGPTPPDGHLRALRPRGADRHPRAGGAPRRRRRGRRGPRRRSSRGCATTCASAASSAPRSCGSSGTSEGRPLPPERWRELCLATVTTHDLPPTAGYLAGEHVDLRERARPADPPGRGGARGRRRRAGGRPGDAARPRAAARRTATSSDVVEALHRYLTWTPARLLGVVAGRRCGDRRTITSPAPTTSTRTGGCRWPDRTARRCCWRT